MLHTLNTENKRKKRIGRGGARGKNSGGGHKGQKSRAGRRIRPAFRDQLEKLPKRRGFNKNRARTVRIDRARMRTITTAQLERNFEANAKITPEAIRTKGLVSKVKGNTPNIKIILRGDLKKPLNIFKCSASESAAKAIVSAGGKLNK